MIYYKDLTGMMISRLKVIEPIRSKMISGHLIPKIHIPEEGKQNEQKEIEY